MARNKHPEKTIEQILEVSTKLFIKQGYEKTTIQDIITELQMSKGAIYHHFKSKEEILHAVINKRSVYAKGMLIELINTTTGKNMRDKISNIMMATILDKKNHEIDSILVSQIYHPEFVLAGMHSAVFDDAPMIAKLFEEGVNDGSITTHSPAICAEMFIFLINIWINPILFSRDLQQTKERLLFMQKTMKDLGADIVTDELIEQIVVGYTNMNSFESQ